MVNPPLPGDHLRSSPMRGRRHPLTGNGFFKIFESPVRFLKNTDRPRKPKIRLRTSIQNGDPLIATENRQTMLKFGKWLAQTICRNLENSQNQSYFIFNDRRTHRHFRFKISVSSPMWYDSSPYENLRHVNGNHTRWKKIRCHINNNQRRFNKFLATKLYKKL